MNALLYAAAARAHGELRSLDVTGCELLGTYALRELRVCAVTARSDLFHTSSPLGTGTLEALLRAAPRLDLFEADLKCGELPRENALARARCALRNEAPFTLLRVHTLKFKFEPAEREEAAVLALAADCASHSHLQRLHFIDAPLDTAAALDAVVDAAIMRRLTSVTLEDCRLTPESAPALVRLIDGGALAELDIWGKHYSCAALLYALDPIALGNALRASSTLTAVSLRDVGLWRYNTAAATALLGALTGHPSLRSLTISNNSVAEKDEEEAGAVVAALVAANAPALTALDVSYCGWYDAGLGPLFDALPGNTHLRTLSCGGGELSDEFMRDTLLPAVRANSSLRKLKTDLNTGVAREAEALVQRRAAAAADAQ
jgi:hypothetical protein